MSKCNECGSETDLLTHGHEDGCGHLYNGRCTCPPPVYMCPVCRQRVTFSANTMTYLVRWEETFAINHKSGHVHDCTICNAKAVSLTIKRLGDISRGQPDLDVNTWDLISKRAFEIHARRGFMHIAAPHRSSYSPGIMTPSWAAPTSKTSPRARTDTCDCYQRAQLELLMESAPEPDPYDHFYESRD